MSFLGTLIPDQPPIYVGIYLDDIIYFSARNCVEHKFEDLLSTIGTVDFMGQVRLFLGTEFTWIEHEGGHITVSLTQKSFTETLIDLLGFDHCGLSTLLRPYCSGQSIDSIPHENMSEAAHSDPRLRYQSLVGSLN